MPAHGKAYRGSMEEIENPWQGAEQVGNPQVAESTRLENTSLTDGRKRRAV